MLTRESALFVSRHSKVAMACLDLCENSNLRVKPIFVDNKHVRAHLLKNSKIKITKVPTLLLIFPDGQVQLYEGFPKISQWIKSVTEHQVQQSNNMYDKTNVREIDTKPISPMQQHYDRKARERQTLAEIEEPHEETELIEDFEGGEDDDGIIFVDEDGNQPAPSVDGLKMDNSKIKSGMSDVMEMAKRLAREREETLGYKEDKLPRYE